MKIECDVCEKAPATVICGADEAALCGECDGEVHAANKLASRHQRHLLDLLPNELPPSDICQVHPPHNISPNLFRDVQQQSTNQMGAKNAWRVKEDVALMSSWCFVSGERKRGKNQKGSLWAQVHKMYTIARDENPEDLRERNVDSMKGRWKRISDNANKWIAAYRKAHSRRTSEMSQNDIEKEAHTIFEADGTSKFQDLFVFNEVMSKNEKWDLKLDYGSTHDENGVDDEESGGSSKRLRTGEDVDNSTPSNPLTLDSGCSTIPCPIGRDMTKRSGKGKVKTSLFPANIEVAETCAMKLTGESEVEVMNKLERDRIELENKKEQRKIMKINSNLLMSLLAKNNLSPAEEDMKRHLMVVLTKQSM